MAKCLVFLAHSETDGSLAAALKSALTSSLGVGPRAVFVSSEGSIRAGEQVLPAVTTALRQARVVVVLLTPSSLRAPWVHFEAGGGAAYEKLIVVCGCGVEPSAFPSDLLHYSVKDLRRASVVRECLRDVASAVKKTPRSPDAAAIRRITQLAKEGHEGWQLVLPALVARQVGGSPFELAKLLHGASKSAFVIGQNLWSLTKGPHASTAKRALFDFLRQKGTTARFLLQSGGPAVDAWNSLNSTFGGDLTRSRGVLEQWLREARRRGINTSHRRRLHIKTAPLVPVSFDIVDAELASGVMVFRHTLHRAPRSADRPVFALQGGQANPIIGHYLSCWNEAFGEADDLEPA